MPEPSVRPRRIVVGVSGASGAALGLECLKCLRQAGAESALVVTRGGEITIEQELGMTLDEFACYADVVYDNKNIGAAIASGTYPVDGMIVAPCSMKTLAGIASGYSENLLLRAADVQMKEQRRLVLMVRETPFSYAHVFPYSRRPGTAADRFDGHLPQQVKQERAARVRAAVEERRQAFWQAQLALPRMLLAADSPAPDQAPARRRKAIKGVNEFYVPCILPAGTHPGRELLAVRPLSVTDKGLLVEPLAD